MTKCLLDFIERSPLFTPEHIEDGYRLLSDKDLHRELNSYRDYCLQEVAIDAVEAGQNLSVLAEGFDSFLPDEELIRRSALYVEDILLADITLTFGQAQILNGNI